jgi:hypothetical protein
MQDRAKMADRPDANKEELKRELSRLEEERAASDILTDRGYPFCFWSPGEVADKIV